MNKFQHVQGGGAGPCIGTGAGLCKEGESQGPDGAHDIPTLVNRQTHKTENITFATQLAGVKSKAKSIDPYTYTHKYTPAVSAMNSHTCTHTSTHAPAAARYNQLHCAVRLDVKFTNVVRQRRVSWNAQRLLVGIVYVGVFFGINDPLYDLESKGQRSSEGQFILKVGASGLYNDI